MKPRLPLGISDFATVRQGGYLYVDKSLLIAEVLEANAQVMLLPRPRRFGKTLQLSMLHRFFADPADRPLFDGLAISKTEHITRQGSQPCIFVSLKDIKEANYEGFLKGIGSLLANLFLEWEDEIETLKPILRQTATGHRDECRQ